MRCFLFKKVLIREMLPINQLITSKMLKFMILQKKLFQHQKIQLVLIFIALLEGKTYFIACNS